MRTLEMVAAVACVSVAALGCSTSKAEAIDLAREGDALRGSNLEEAVSKYEQATALDPSNHRLLWKLALAYHAQEDWSKDASTCAMAEKRAPTFATYSFEHGYAVAQQATKGAATWSEAESLLVDAIQKDPNLAQAYEELGDVAYHLGQEQEALKRYTEAIERNPDELGYYAPLADLLERLGYRNEAVRVLREAVARGREDDRRLVGARSLLRSIGGMPTP